MWCTFVSEPLLNCKHPVTDWNLQCLYQRCAHDRYKLFINQTSALWTEECWYTNMTDRHASSCGNQHRHEKCACVRTVRCGQCEYVCSQGQCLTNITRYCDRGEWANHKVCWGDLTLKWPGKIFSHGNQWKDTNELMEIILWVKQQHCINIFKVASLCLEFAHTKKLPSFLGSYWVVFHN